MKNIEVEGKFMFDEKSLLKLKSDSKLLCNSKFTDTYFDDDIYSLTTKNVWLRKRDSKFEMKVPLPSTKTNNKLLDCFKELNSEDEILQYLGIQKTNKSTEEILEEFGYKIFAKFTTERTTYQQGKFKIDLDSADFGYCVGEIEVMVENTEENIRNASQEIEQFAKRYNLQLYNRTMRGKLLEYIHRFNKNHYQALVEAGLFKI